MDGVVDGFHDARVGATAPPANLVNGYPSVGCSAACRPGCQPVQADVADEVAAGRRGRVGAMAIGVSGRQEVAVKEGLVDVISIPPCTDELPVATV